MNTTNIIKKLKWNPELVTKFWDYQSNFPDLYFTNQFGDQIVKLISKNLDKGSLVLDYACGTGSLTKNLLKSNFKVAACDVSESSINIVNKNHFDNENFKGAFLINDLLDLNIKFDAIILIELIEHVDDDILDNIFNIVNLLLNPGGFVVISTPNNENLELENVYCPCCDHTFHKWQHIRNWNSKSLNDLLLTYNFKSISVLETNLALAKNKGIFSYYLTKFIHFLKNKKYNPHLFAFAKK